MSKFSEPFQDFAARHGDYIEVGGGVCIFEDGAMSREGGHGRPPARNEPLDDPEEALRIRRQYEELNRRRQGESRADFAKRHGGSPVLVNGSWLFEDGAGCDQSGIARWEPPADEYGRLRARQLYAEAKLESELSAFHTFQADCLERAYFSSQNPSCPPPPADAAEQLSRGSIRIQGLREQLASLEEKLAQTPEGRVEHLRRQATSESRQRLDEQLAAIKLRQYGLSTSLQLL